MVENFYEQLLNNTNQNKMNNSNFNYSARTLYAIQYLREQRHLSQQQQQPLVASEASSWYDERIEELNIPAEELSYLKQCSQEQLDAMLKQQLPAAESPHLCTEYGPQQQQPAQQQQQVLRNFQITLFSTYLTIYY